jgi:hypothetical protein
VIEMLDRTLYVLEVVMDRSTLDERALGIGY